MTEPNDAMHFFTGFVKYIIPTVFDGMRHSTHRNPLPKWLYWAIRFLPPFGGFVFL